MLRKRDTVHHSADKPNNTVRAQLKHARYFVTVREVASVPQALDDDDAFRQLLADCKLFSAGPRNGLVPFDADCLARRVARHTGHDQPRALAHLAHWAASLGGGLEDTILWLPANQYGDPG